MLIRYYISIHNFFNNNIHYSLVFINLFFFGIIHRCSHQPHPSTTPPPPQASIDNNLAIVKVLLKNGANVNALDKESWTPLHASATCGHPQVTQLLIDKYVWHLLSPFRVLVRFLFSFGYKVVDIIFLNYIYFLFNSIYYYYSFLLSSLKQIQTNAGNGTVHGEQAK